MLSLLFVLLPSCSGVHARTPVGLALVGLRGELDPRDASSENVTLAKRSGGSCLVFSLSSSRTVPRETPSHRTELRNAAAGVRTTRIPRKVLSFLDEVQSCRHTGRYFNESDKTIAARPERGAPRR